MLTKIVVTDVNEIGRLKKDIAKESYIEEWRHLSIPIANITSIDNRLKEALFANWILDSSNFTSIKAKYKILANPLNATNTIGANKSKKITHYVISNHNLTLVQELFGLTPINVQVNATRLAAVIVPRNLQLALFDEWPQKEKIILLLGQFAKDMELSTVVAMTNGTQLVLRPPDPPKGHHNTDYQYKKYGMQLSEYHFSHLVRILVVNAMAMTTEHFTTKAYYVGLVVFFLRKKKRFVIRTNHF